MPIGWSLKSRAWASQRYGSRAARPTSAIYLMRPDLGRRLKTDDAQALEQGAGSGCDLALVVADGLSALAVQRHAPALLAEVTRAVPATGACHPS